LKRRSTRPSPMSKISEARPAAISVGSMLTLEECPVAGR
jgi:hypothetical protein